MDLSNTPTDKVNVYFSHSNKLVISVMMEQFTDEYMVHTNGDKHSFVNIGR